MSNLIPIGNEFETLKTICKYAVDSGFLPESIKTPQQALIIALKGREVRIPPMQAFAGISVIGGKPAMGSELMLALIYRDIPGAIVDFIETDMHKCIIDARRPNGKLSRFSFTIEDAKAADLLNKGPWKKYPAAMLRARCISSMARAIFPDALCGISYTPEELGAAVNEEELREVAAIEEQAPVKPVNPSTIDQGEFETTPPPVKPIKRVEPPTSGPAQPGKDFRVPSKFERPAGTPSMQPTVPGQKCRCGATMMSSKISDLKYPQGYWYCKQCGAKAGF